MKSKDLEKLFKYVSMVELDNYYLYDDLELYNIETGESIQFESIDDVLKNDDIREQLSGIKVNYYSGGRGAKAVKLGGGFQSSGGRRSKVKSLLPAELNAIGGKNHNLETVVKKFISKYGGANREYGASIDEQGYAHKYVQGGKSNVSISTAGKNHTIIHNHPSGGNFSKQDLVTFASTKDMKGIIATNKKTAYRMEKTSKFKSKEFLKALKDAKWPTHLSYDKGAEWWLKRNASKFGYKYEHK